MNEIRIISSYPPRACGIATFSANLANSFEHFREDVGQIRVAAIDSDRAAYDTPVDLVIDQYSSDSWRRATEQIIARSREQVDCPVVLMQHEYGLDTGPDRAEARGRNFIETAAELRTNGIMTFVYLHTVLDQPDSHQKEVLQMLGETCDGLLVPTVSAVDMLESCVYSIARQKVKHIDHGIRMQNPSQYDRLEIKKDWGLEDCFLVCTPGLHSPGKGLQFSIPAYARFLEQSCTSRQRSRLVYLIAGTFHPGFVNAEDGRLYREYRATLDQVLNDSGVTHCTIHEMSAINPAEYDVVFLDEYLSDRMLLSLYAASNAILMPYLNMQQISSGILADTLGCGRVAIATKFRYAVEMLNPRRQAPEGLILDPSVRGILVDPGEKSVDHMAQALDYVVFNHEERLAMERRAHARGHQMRWDNAAWQLLQHMEFVRERRDKVTGRGPEFTRAKASMLQMRRDAPAESSNQG